jgi:hypothetical protein
MAPAPRLGDLAVRRGFASAPEIETALDFQRNFEPSADRPEAPVGRILVEMGALTEEMLAALLEEQAKLRTPAARLSVESPGPVAVNGRPVTDPRPLEPGDEIRVGGAVLRYEGPPVLLVPSPAPAGGVLGKVSGAARKGLESVRTITTRILPKKETVDSTLKGAGDTVRKLIKTVARKRYRNKAEAVRRRDELLARVGAAELDAGVPGPDAEAARKARRTLEESERLANARGSATSAADVASLRTAIRAAREQLDLALVRLGWQAVREGRSPAGLDEAVKEIHAIDEAFSEER